MKTKTLLAFVAIALLGYLASNVIGQTVYPSPWIQIPPPQAEETSSLSLPADAREIVNQYEAKKAEIEKNARRQIRQRRLHLIAALKELQDTYTREAKLDDAVAIRDCIRALKEPAENVLPDPGTVNRYPVQIGQVLYYRVTGQRGGTVWGTDVYTADSMLAAASVHAGVLKEGQTGVVKVTILPGRNHYSATTRNGIASYEFSSYPISYKVEPAEDDETVNPADEKHGQPTEMAVAPQDEEPLPHQMENLRKDFSRLQRQIRDLSGQLKKLREEVQTLQKPTGPLPSENR